MTASRLALCAMLTLGCAPKVVYQPIPCPPPIHVERPALPIDRFVPGKWEGKELEMILWQSLIIQSGYTLALEKALALYEPKK